MKHIHTHTLPAAAPAPSTTGTGLRHTESSNVSSTPPMSFQHQASVYSVAPQASNTTSAETGGFGSVDDVATDSTEQKVRGQLGVCVQTGPDPVLLACPSMCAHTHVRVRCFVAAL